MKLKLSAAICALSILATGLFAQAAPSLVASTSMWLFTNEIDWTAGPNKQFNKLTKNFILGGLDSTGVGTDAAIGYYKAGDMPFAIKATINAVNDFDPVESESSGTGYKSSTTAKRPLFNSYDSYLSGTIGLPQFSDLSIGLQVGAFGNDDGYESATNTNGVKTEADLTNKDGTLYINVPFGFQAPKFYNYGYVSITRSFDLYKDKAAPALDLDRSEVVVGFYDKATFASLLKGGTETAVWVSLGSPDRANFTTSVYTSTAQIGISNRFDLEIAEGITFALNPQFYINGTFTDTRSATPVTLWDISNTLASDLSLRAKLGASPFTLYTGITPFIRFSTKSNESESTIVGITTTTKNKGAEIETDYYRNALLGITAKLPGDVAIDLQIVDANTYKVECVIPLK